jgi:hypothetical protein
VPFIAFLIWLARSFDVKGRELAFSLAAYLLLLLYLEFAGFQHLFVLSILGHIAGLFETEYLLPPDSIGTVQTIVLLAFYVFAVWRFTKCLRTFVPRQGATDNRAGTIVKWLIIMPFVLIGVLVLDLFIAVSPVDEGADFRGLTMGSVAGHLVQVAVLMFRDLLLASVIYEVMRYFRGLGAPAKS